MIRRNRKFLHKLKKHPRAAWIGLLCGFLFLGGAFAYAADSSGDPEDVDTESVTAESVEYYIALDGAWQRVGSGQELPGKTTAFSSVARYYTTPEALETYYNKFGFKADSYNGELIFPHTAGNDTEQIWADLTPLQNDDGEWMVPLATTNKIYVYYLPGNVAGNESYFNTHKDLSDKTMLKENMFYSISLSDPDKKVPDFPVVSYVRSGDSWQITLPISGGYEWECVDRGTLKSFEPDSAEKSEDGTELTLTFRHVTRPIKIEPVNPINTRLKVVYNAGNLAENLQPLSQVSAGSQSVVQDGSIYGNASYTSTLTLADKEYKVLTPDNHKALVKIPGSSKEKKYWYTFQGWRLGESNIILQPGETLSIDRLRTYETGGEITLNATWTGKSSNGRTASANFYVNKSCEVSDNLTDGLLPNPEENFTNSIYTSRVNEADTTPVNLYNDYLLLAPDSGQDNAYEIDSRIRGLTETDCEGVTMEDFPSDEEVLSALRRTYKESNPIKVGDRAISKDELTTANFKVRWSTMKYVHSDGWHIDGILVAKSGMLVIRKDFAGDAESAIRELQDDFSISVTHTEESDSSTSEVQDYNLVLKSSDEAGEGETGYTSYDEATHVYTWVLKVRDYQEYNIKEQNYDIKNFDKSEHTYMIRNAPEGIHPRDGDAAMQSIGWQTYPEEDGISVVAGSYPDDVPISSYQTVELKNMYVNSYYITLNKLDDFTYGGMSDIEFKISRLDGSASLQLYQRPGSNVYASREDETFTDEVTDNLIRTDSTGMLHMMIPAGTYMLEEQTPKGYQEGYRIKIQVESSTDGHTYISNSVLCDAEGNEITEDSEFISFDKNSSMLTINNHAEQLTTVTATADMGDVKADSVQVELWCGGSKVEGSQYTQTLSAENNWTYTWNDLPLYTDGSVADYKLREIAIGDTSYDSHTDGDGYEDYTVTCDACKYRESDDGEFSDQASWEDENGAQHFSKHALLVLHNANVVVEPQYVTVNVETRWDDDNNQDGIRPDYVDLKLFDENGVQSGNGLSLSEDSNWTGSFPEREKYSGKDELQYYITDESFDAIDGYTAEITGDMESGYVITFTHKSSTLDISGEKIWIDGNDAYGERPDSVTIDLLANGEKTDSQTVSADNGWKISFPDQPEYNAGEKIQYSIREETVPHYTASYSEADGELLVTNIFTPAALDGETAVTGKLLLTGRDMLDDERFDFSLEAADDATSAAIADGTIVMNDTTASLKSLADGQQASFSFGRIEFTKEGVYTFRITQTAGQNAGITYDTDAKVFRVTVTTENGNLKATQDSVPEFTNSYDATGTFTPSGTKTLFSETGTKLNITDGQFTFRIAYAGQKDIEVSTGTTGTGTDAPIHFDSLSYRIAGKNGLKQLVQDGYATEEKQSGSTVYTLNYQVTENQPSNSALQINTQLQTFRVLVTDAGTGTLQVETEGGNALNFENIYKSDQAVVNVNGLKILNGRALKDGEFTFRISSEDPAAPMPEHTEAQNTSGGEIDFGTLTFGKDDLGNLTEKTFTYKITESGSQLGVQNDTDVKEIQITVTDDGEGHITAAVQPKSQPLFTFTNTYQATEGTSSPTDTIQIQKILAGRALEADEFTFVLKDADGKEVGRGTNDAKGSITLPELTFANTGAYNYTVEEEKGTLSSIVYDETVYSLTAVVTDSYDGSPLHVVWSCGTGETTESIFFTNTYKAPDDNKGDDGKGDKNDGNKGDNGKDDKNNGNKGDNGDTGKNDKNNVNGKTDEPSTGNTNSRGSDSSQSNTVATGDTASTPGLWIAGIVMIAAVVTIVMLLRRRKK